MTEKNKSQAAREAADTLQNYGSMGANVRTIVEARLLDLIDAGLVTDDDRMTAVSKTLLERSKRGMVTRSERPDGMRGWTYFPLPTADAPTEAGMGVESEPPAPYVFESVQENTLTSPAEEAPGEFLITIADGLAEKIYDALKVAMCHVRADALRTVAMPDADRHLAALREIEAAMRLIRPDWAETLKAVCDHLEHENTPY